MKNSFDTEAEESYGEQEEKSSKAKAYGLFLIALSVLLLSGTYYYYSKVSKSDLEPSLNYSDIVTGKEPPTKEEQNLDLLRAQLKSKEEQIAMLLGTQAMLEKNKDGTARLSYVIKPKENALFEFYAMENGSWTLPSGAAASLQKSAKELMAQEKYLVAFEVRGVVDNNPYAGPSAELKQEGLASFRAKEAIIALESLDNAVVAFEGPSLQTPNKRGFLVRAYLIR